MASVVKLTPEMFPEVRDSLLAKLDPNMPRSRWEHAFSDLGWHREDHLGYALTDGGKIVGALGTLYSERTIDGRSMRFCNLHGWYVLPEYRRHGLLLLRPIMALREHTITDFSAASDAVVTISKRLGFTLLDRTAIVMLAMPRKAHVGVEIISLAQQPELADELLDAPGLRIFRDHRATEVGQLVIRDGKGHCHLVYSRTESSWLTYCTLHYLSNRALFRDHHGAIRRYLMRATGTRYVVVESRLVAPMKIPYSVRVVTNEKLYRSPGVPPEQIDTLYSEMILLKLQTLRWQTIVKHFLPGPVATCAKRLSGLRRGA